MAEVGLWRGVKGLTPIAFVLEKEAFAQKLQLSFFPTCFLCVERIFNFLETRIFKRCVFTVLCVLQAVQSLEISF